MKLRLSPLAVTLGVLVTSAIVLAGQAKGPNPPPPPIPPGPLAAANFGKVVAGDVTGDLALDAIVLDARLPTLSMAPEVHDTSVRADTLVDDIVCMPGNGVDRLFVVGSGGLRELVYDTTARDLDELDVDTVTWSGAWALATGAFDGPLENDLVALSGSTDVLVLHAAEAGSFTAGASFTTYGPTHSVQTMDWEGDGTDEIVIWSDAGIEIYDPDGGEVAWQPWSGAFSAVVSDPDHVGERLAVISEVSGNDWVVLWDQGGVDLFRNLGPLDLQLVTAADVDQDGDSDLLLSLTSGPEYGLILGRHDQEQLDLGLDPAAPLYSAATLSLVPFGDSSRDASGNEAGLVTGDFDRDGDIDVMAPATGNYVAGEPDGSNPYSDLVITWGSSADEDDHRLTIDSSDIVVIEPQLPTRWDIGITGPDIPLATSGDETLALEIEVWETSGLYGYTESDRYDRQEVALPGVGVTQIESIWLPWATGDRIYTVVCRQIRKQGGDVVGVGPSATFVNGPDGEAIQAWLGGGLLPTQVHFENGTVNPGGGGSTGTSTPNGRDDEGAQAR